MTELEYKSLIAQMDGVIERLSEAASDDNGKQEKLSFTEAEIARFPKSINAFYLLSSAAARRLPFAFRRELKFKGDYDYRERRYVLNWEKRVTDDGNTQHKVYIYSRLRNGEKEEISGSGATLPEAENAFIKAVKAVKLPPQTDCTEAD